LGLGTFCGLGRFGVGTFCSRDVLELGPFVLGHFVVERFVLGRFEGAPKNITLKKYFYIIVTKNLNHTIRAKSILITFFIVVCTSQLV
jgi:hypothetical protein